MWRSFFIPVVLVLRPLVPRLNLPVHFSPPVPHQTAHANGDKPQLRTTISALASEALVLHFGSRNSYHFVAMKFRSEREVKLTREQDAFVILERHRPSPYTVRRFSHIQEAIALEYAPKEDLAFMLSKQHLQDGKSRQVTGVVNTLPLEYCLLRMKQLGAPAAWVEKLGLARCDIRYGNVLLSPCASKAGTFRPLCQNRPVSVFRNGAICKPSRQRA